MAGFTSNAAQDATWIDLDPRCPKVVEHEGYQNADDPMTDAMGADEFVGEANQAWGRRHYGKCERCKRYAQEHFAG